MRIDGMEAGPGSVVDIPSGPVLPTKVQEGNLFLLTLPVPVLFIGLSTGWRNVVTDTLMVAENATNRYFSETRVWSSPITSLSLVNTTPVVVTDTLISAIGKLQAQHNAHAGSTTGHPTATITTSGFMSATDKVKLDAQIATRKYLAADSVNMQLVANTLQTIADLSFAVVVGQSYTFKFIVPYTAAATTTGSRWTLSGPAASILAYTSRYPLTATTETVNYASAYGIPAAANASSLTAGNVAIIEGMITPSAAGTVALQFASEITLSAITAKAGASLTYTAH